MSNITLSIGGRDYTVACAEGEESHVTALGQVIAGKLEALPGAVAQSETRSLLFAALLLADEVHDLRAASPAQSPEPAAGNLDNIASRLEKLAAHLESRAASA